MPLGVLVLSLPGPTPGLQLLWAAGRGSGLMGDEAWAMLADTAPGVPGGCCTRKDGFSSGRDSAPGDSGGPLLDASGRVIGINTAASKAGQPDAPGRRGFAVPINAAISVAEQVREGASAGTVHVGPTAVLGVRVSTRVDVPVGAEVTEVLPGTPADRIRLRPGDVIIQVDDVRISSAEDLTGRMDLHGPGDGVLVHWVDASGNQFSATATLAEGLPA